MVQKIYECLKKATKENGEKVSVYWDTKCLASGQTWDKSLPHLLNATVVVLIISNKVLICPSCTINKLYNVAMLGT